MIRLLAFIGCSLLGVGIGYTIAMATRLSVPSATAGDWLAFSGAVAGVMLTIGATLAIEIYSRSWRYRAAIRRLRGVLEKVARAASNVRYETPREFGTGKAWFDTSRLTHSLLEAIAQYKFIREQIFVENVDLWSQLRRLDLATGEAVPVLERQLELLEAARSEVVSKHAGDHLSDLAAYRKIVSGAAAAIQSSAHDLRKTLKAEI